MLTRYSIDPAFELTLVVVLSPRARAEESRLTDSLSTWSGIRCEDHPLTPPPYEQRLIRSKDRSFHRKPPAAWLSALPQQRSRSTPHTPSSSHNPQPSWT